MDLVKGNTEVDLFSQSDPVLRRADGSYLYHFPSVVDDIDMKISHIIRGEDHLSNSAVHSELFQSLGSNSPSFAALSRSVSSAAILDPSFGGPRMPSSARYTSPPKYRQR